MANKQARSSKSDGSAITQSTRERAYSDVTNANSEMHWTTSTNWILVVRVKPW